MPDSAPARLAELAISDWHALRTFAERLQVGRGFERAYAFRGQADAAWRILPSLHRAAMLDGLKQLPSVEDLLSLERDLLARFREAAPTMLPSAILAATKGNADWWTIMQHFGVPTRLVDWTQSFYVAAYFAASGSAGADGAIYVLHLSSFKDGTCARYGASHVEDLRLVDLAFSRPDASPALHMIGRGTALPDRMYAQQSCFMTSVNVGTDIEAELAACVVPAYGLKVRIAKAMKPDIMRHLRSMNVTAASLFPGLDGIGRSLGDTVRYP